MVTVRLFGKLEIARDRRVLYQIPGGRTQELFCYLVLHRHQVQPRDALATMLWPDCETTKSKKYLRQVLWQLQLALSACVADRERQPLVVEADTVRMDNGRALRRCSSIAAI
jgi:DNA-binding SARP family transcriptional activator